MTVIERARTFVHVQAGQLQPGDVIDAANYKYRDTPVWAEVKVVEPFPENPGYVRILLTSAGRDFWLSSGQPINPLNLYVTQVPLTEQAHVAS